jgi:hypothetical protein
MREIKVHVSNLPRIRISSGDVKMIGLTMFYLQTWVLGEPLDVVLDVPDCLDHPLSPFLYWYRCTTSTTTNMKWRESNNLETTSYFELTLNTYCQNPAPAPVHSPMPLNGTHMCHVLSRAKLGSMQSLH